MLLLLWPELRAGRAFADGVRRALQVINSKEERWEMQFKGAGPTPYSRAGDGRKVLRSSIREFLCSEAMHFLGIPTTRAASIITSDTRVTRDIFYSGNPIEERATVIVRIAPTFLRFGSFEIAKPTDRITGRAGPSAGNPAIVKQLLDHTIATYYPNLSREGDVYANFFTEICRRTAQLVAGWQAVGFCHGVLNTDNMSIIGVTIDYGPYGFMERFDPDFICNASDDSGRYDYKSQPDICRWNLKKLAEALHPTLLLSDAHRIVEATYDTEYAAAYMARMRTKLGLVFTEEDGDKQLIERFFSVLAETNGDFTQVFRALSSVVRERAVDSAFGALKPHLAPLRKLRSVYQTRVRPEQLAHLREIVENPIMAAAMGLPVAAVEDVLRRYDMSQQLATLTEDDVIAKNRAAWATWLPDYFARLERDDAGRDAAEAAAARVEKMNGANPAFVLRNSILQRAIAKAEDGDFSGVQQLLERIQTPYAEVADEGVDMPDVWQCDNILVT